MEWNPSISHKLHKICMVALFGRRQHERAIVSMECLLISCFYYASVSACFVRFDSVLFCDIFLFLLLVYFFDRICLFDWISRGLVSNCIFLRHVWPHRCFIRSALNFKRGLLPSSTSFFSLRFSLSLLPLTLHLSAWFLKLSAGFKFGVCVFFFSLHSLGCLYTPYFGM